MDQATRFAEYGAALVSDAAFRAGKAVAVPTPGLAPQHAAHAVAGPVRTVEANNDLVTIIAAVQRARPGEVLVIANRTFEVGVIGDLIATDALLRGLAGIIVDGCIRDSRVLATIDLPVFSRGRIPVGPLKLATEAKGIGRFDEAVTVGGVTVEPGMWAVADLDGVVFVHASDLDTIVAEAEVSLDRERHVLAQLRAGESLSHQMDVEAFLSDRSRDPEASFNDHLARVRKAI